ncbi:hypothetical protein LOK49_LG08G00689 [Camellia lanceoleosa]|uniref:Uncharacterized protein n=1 Tax=Camellia lanceoleosa TaxID=1840588 RepID=A0ACC0GVP8_9ERIC|nr:hypothetical protein LOK49_LG08G00689 [Camellia lanceoleosa]
MVSNSFALESESNPCNLTPEGSLLDIIRNAYDLLSHCDIKIPKIEGNDKYVDSGPPYLIFLHPALGPLWEVTRQKVRDEEQMIGLILSMTLILGVYGAINLQLGSNCSLLITPNPLFVESIKVEQLDEANNGPILYGFYKEPPRDVVTTWSETQSTYIPAHLYKAS